jgi:ABC-type lipoprotein export system ATPase subunit
LIRAEQVGHAYDGRDPLFTDLDFAARSGEVLAVTGPSGSGKSTLLGIVAGLLEPSMGRLHRDAGERAVWVFQNPHGVAGRTALDHVVLPLLTAGSRRRQAEVVATGILEQFHLEDLAPRPFRELSGGEAQRLMLARAVAARPDLLLVDEPTAQLDTVSARGVTAALHGLSTSGAVVLVATHDERVVSACSRTIALGR